LEIGKLKAEKVKRHFCAHYFDNRDGTISVTGLNVVKGLPESKEVSSQDVKEVLYPIVETIVDAVHNVLEETEPELVADIISGGIRLTGGGSYNPLVKEMLEVRIGLEVIHSKTPLDSVGNGLMRKLKGYTIRQKSSVHNY